MLCCGPEQTLPHVIEFLIEDRLALFGRQGGMVFTENEGLVVLLCVLNGLLQLRYNRRTGSGGFLRLVFYC